MSVELNQKDSELACLDLAVFLLVI